MRNLFMLLGVLCYAIFFATFLYLIAFVGAVPLVPLTVDVGPDAAMLPAIAIDVGLIALFGVQHSVMARPAFKKSWTRIVPPALERSVYVLLASIMLIILFVGWHPVPLVLWSVANPVVSALLWGVFALGWAIVLLSTFLINHFELFGLKQVWANLRAQPDVAPRFATPFFYRFVRHPLYSGFIIAFWATPEMTLGHAVLAAGMTAYILIAIGHEERDLVGLFGADYQRYQARVGMLAPGIGRHRS